MASLNIPFLVFSRSTFTFETRPECYCSLDNRANIDVANTLLISNPKGEIIIFSYELDVLLRRRSDIGHAIHSTTFYNLLLHPKLLMLPSISVVEKVGPLVDVALVENPSKYILVSPSRIHTTERHATSLPHSARRPRAPPLGHGRRPLHHALNEGAPPYEGVPSYRGALSSGQCNMLW